MICGFLLIATLKFNTYTRQQAYSYDIPRYKARQTTEKSAISPLHWTSRARHSDCTLLITLARTCVFSLSLSFSPGVNVPEDLCSLKNTPISCIGGTAASGNLQQVCPLPPQESLLPIAKETEESLRRGREGSLYGNRRPGQCRA